MPAHHQTNQPTAKTKRRLIIFALAALLLIPFVNVIYTHREPSYQGKPLRAWLDDLDSDTAKRAAATEAIIQMGAATVPYITKTMRFGSFPLSLHERWNVWLAENFDAPVQVPLRRDQRVCAKEAFCILGPKAKSAAPALTAMLGNFSDELQAVSLLAIGPEAIPALTNALSSTNVHVRSSVLEILGAMGANAAETIPLLARLMQDPDPQVAAEAVMSVGEMGRAAEPLLAQLEQKLLQTNYTESSAFALSTLRKIEPLVYALTNENAIVRGSAAAGLEFLPLQAQPYFGQFRRSIIDYYRGAKTWFYQSASANLKRAQTTPHYFDLSVVRLLVTNLNNPQPSTRALIANQLANFSSVAEPALPALSHLLTDPNETVRQAAADAIAKIQIEAPETSEGGIIRGPKARKEIALEFTGHNFAEGGETILNELARHHAKASFFLTGDFLRNPQFHALTQRIVADGHYLGPHSDKHLLYCPWEGPKTNLIIKPLFNSDLRANLEKILSLQPSAKIGYWIPSHEWYNHDIANWSDELGLTLVNYTPGTRANADYTQETDPNFVSSRGILDSIIKKEREDPHGLNGFLLLMHLGAGPGRKDKMHDHLGDLLDFLETKGYKLVRIDELLRPNTS